MSFTTFMQNEPNFEKAQMNVTKVLTKDYEEKCGKDLWKNEPKTNPIQTQFKPNQSQRFILAFLTQAPHTNRPTPIFHLKTKILPTITKRNQTKPHFLKNLPQKVISLKVLRCSFALWLLSFPLSPIRYTLSAIIIRLFARFLPAFVLHPPKRVGQDFRQFPIAHILYLFSRYHFAVADQNRTGRENLFMPRPTFKGPVNHYRHNRRPSASAQKTNTALEGRNFPIARTRAFWEKTKPPTVLKFADDLPHRGYVRFALLYRHRIHRRNQRAEKPIGKKRITRNKAQRPLQRPHAKYRVKIALVVTDQYKSPFSRDIFSAVSTHSKKQNAKNSAYPARKPEPSCFQSFFKHFSFT